MPDRESPHDWSPATWATRPGADIVSYPDPMELDRAVQALRGLPPLVTSWEIESLREQLAQAQAGTRFLLQGGDCAEALDECTSDSIASRLKILLQMSLVLVHGTGRPIIRVGRFAGQYAKPRSSPTETREVAGQRLTLPSYFGDLFNAAPFAPDARRPDPHRMVRAYQHAALTLNFIRALIDGGFADLHHPEYWDLSFFRHASLSPERRHQYEEMTRSVSDGLRFMEALGERQISQQARTEFFCSHEGLSLHYESAQTRAVPRRAGHYLLTTHLPWIGDRTRDPSGAHVEFFRGIRNPVAVKLGPTATGEQALRLCEILDPANEPGKMVLIPRLGARSVERALPSLVEPVARAGRRVLWVSDPMHANTTTTSDGIKTRLFDDIRAELEASIDAHRRLGTHLGGIHVELTGQDVTECLGGASGVTEADLATRYDSLCDPRLNYQQALELAFVLAARLRPTRA